ncbi:BTAD domain-containing putative transcriptional regulator [Oceanobacillus sp. CAU 1775]
MRNIPIIHSQLSPPPIRNRFIQRSNMNKKLAGLANYPLTLLFAGAGYGKSTALALYANSNQKPVCWYAISKNDDDLFPFLIKLIESIRQKYATFGKSIEQELLHLDNYITDEEIYRLATLFINDAVKQQDKIILILDDFHHVLQSSEIEKWIFHILEYMPANLHIIISSRKKPRWKLLPRLRGQGELLELTQYDLIFTPEEMSYLLEEVYAIEVTKEDISKIYRMTEGWAIAFNMLVQQIESADSIQLILQNQKTSLKDFFAYLATEVLAKQSLITQQFLMQSSIFQELTPEVCDQVLEVGGSKAILSGLVEQNLFIEEIEGNVYRYHALFQAFLENLFIQRHEAEYKTLHRRAAEYYKGKTDIESALYHYKQIGDSSRISSLIYQYGLKILHSGRHQALYDLLLSVDPIDKGKYPILYFYQGEIERYRSLYEQAEKSYDALITSITDENKKSDYLLSLAFEGKARIYLDTIQPDHAKRYVSEAIKRREKTAASVDEMAKLYLLMSENLLNAGKAEEAQTWFERANEIELPLENSNLQARIYLRTGKLQKAKELLMKNYSHANMEESHLAQAHRETNLLLSFINGLMGEAETSKELATSGIQLGLTIQSPFVEACGWMRLGHAVHLLDRYDSELAIQCYKTALNMMENINVSRGKAEPYMGLAILYGINREYNQARKHAEKALVETDKVSDRWLSSLIRIGYGMTEVYERRFDRAKELFHQARTELEVCGDQYGLAIVSFWLSYIAYLEKDNKAFIQEMTNFLKKIEEEDFIFFLKRRTIFGPNDMQNIIPLLLEARKLEIEPQFTLRIINELGLDGQIENHPGYTLKIQSLGQLRVWLGDEEREVQDWQRGKAKELFMLFITYQEQLLRREEIFQFLWPNLDEETANKNFKVALNALHKAIEPDRKARQEAFFINREGSSYQLNADSGVELDSFYFEKLIQEGIEKANDEQAQEILEKGLKLYQADYLAELQYTSWIETERKRLQQIFIRGAEKLAQIHVRLQQFNQCINWCERILELDNTWEEAYRLLMYCYYQNNNRPQAMKWYDQCCKVLEEELGIEPMEPTTEMYEMIIEAEELEIY